MANKGISKYTVQESQNIQLGQCRSAYLDSNNAYTCSNSVIVAITIIQDCEFETLTAENPNYCFGDNSTDAVYTDSGCGDVIVNSTVFPAGITLYGRWTTLDLATGVVVIYMSK
jgi:hypothetical protein